MEEIKFLKKNASSLKCGVEPYLVISVSGSVRHKYVHFAFRNGLGKRISKTGYIMVSDIDENSKIIYFSDASKEEGYSIAYNESTRNCSITINLHEYALKIEQYNWDGAYKKFYFEDGYYCVKLADREEVPKKYRSKKTIENK